ncbi:MAG: hypothetical protein WAM44_00410, partial [Chthoniobacterales bacterium]
MELRPRHAQWRGRAISRQSRLCISAGYGFRDPLRGSRPRGLHTFKIEDEDDDQNDYEVLAR